jgi:hypothetical protein
MSPNPRASFGVKEQSTLLSLAQTISFMMRKEYEVDTRSEQKEMYDTKSDLEDLE